MKGEAEIIMELEKKFNCEIEFLTQSEIEERLGEEFNPEIVSNYTGQTLPWTLLTIWRDEKFIGALHAKSAGNSLAEIEEIAA